MSTSNASKPRDATGSTRVDFAGLSDSVHSMAVSANGAVWLAGLSYNGNSHDFSLARLRPDGTLDTRFSEDGKASLQAGITPSDGWSLAVQVNGALLVGQLTGNGGNLAMRVSRFNPDGSLDTGFGTAGSVSLASSLAVEFTSLQVLPDGEILALQRSETTAEVYHLHPDGAPDTTFNGNGHATLQLPEGIRYDYDPGFTAQADGKFLLAGISNFSGASGDFSVSRWKADGTADTDFGVAGTANFDIGGSFDYGYTVAVQPDGKVLIAGASDMGATDDYNMAVVRLNADGSLDATFGIDGKATYDIAGEYDTARALSVLPDGKILVGGQSNQGGNGDFVAIRINADGSLDTTFGALADGMNHLDGSSGHNVLIGGEDADTISGHGGNDLVDGGGGRDILTGGTGADVFRFSTLEGSYRTARDNLTDRIRDFDPGQDLIDLTALSFSGLGDGHDGTLAVLSNGAGTRTYLKSYDGDAQGRRFEVSLNGDLAATLNTEDFLFAQGMEAATPQLLGAALSEPAV